MNFNILKFICLCVGLLALTFNVKAQDYGIPNYNDLEIEEALGVLNDNFNGNNYFETNFGLKEPSFNSLVADVGHEFYLAEENYNCEPIDPISWHQVSKTSFSHGTHADDILLNSYGYIDAKYVFNEKIIYQ